jgi:type II secretory pathway pseudopilin PulG
MHIKTLIAVVVLAGWSTLAGAKLPPPTPAQVEAQAAKKAAADAQAEKDKVALLAKYDELSARWRSKAAEKGLKVNAPTPLPAATAAVTTPATQSAPSGQPDGKLTATAAAAPMTSEKSNTAVQSADIKRAPSPPASSVKTK